MNLIIWSNYSYQQNVMNVRLRNIKNLSSTYEVTVKDLFPALPFLVTKASFCFWRTSLVLFSAFNVWLGL